MMISRIKDRFSRKVPEPSAPTLVVKEGTELPVYDPALISGFKEVSGMLLDSSSSIEEMSAAVSDIAQSCNVQNTSIHELHTLLFEFANKIIEMKSSASAVDKAVNTSVELRDEAHDKTRDLQVVSDKVVEVFDVIVNQVYSLGDVLKDINNSTEVLDNIASQTNFLALNATIEAAHAKEYGRGFGIVADEVKKLAEQARENSSRIKSEIGHVMSVLNSLTGTVSASKELVEQQKKDTIAVRGAFTQVGKRLDRVTTNMGKLFIVFEECFMLKEDSLKKSELISEHSESISATVEQIAASLEDQSSTASSVVETAQNLENIIKEKVGSVDVI